MLAEHSALGSANTQLGVQRERPSLYETGRRNEEAYRADARAHRRRGLAVPDAGDLDEAVDPFRGTRRDAEFGHTINIEEPDEFNRIVGNFLAQVDAAAAGRPATPRALSASHHGHEAVTGAA